MYYIAYFTLTIILLSNDKMNAVFKLKCGRSQRKTDCFSDPPDMVAFVDY